MLLGWVHRVRDLGGLLFIDIRDRGGITQVVFDKDDETLMAKAKRLRSEFVIGVAGRVQRRSPDHQPEAADRRSRSRGAPAGAAQRSEDAAVSDCRRYARVGRRAPEIPLPGSTASGLQANIGLRHRVTTAIRQHFDRNGFWEVETPILTKSTPEGARDYLIPSRVHPGEFYALPQSPQLFKQILMIGGVDRHVQICRCFRDEDLRADRQPEFTQVDVERHLRGPRSSLA